MKHAYLLLTALTLLFGAQSFRVLLPGLTWYAGTTLDLGPGPVLAGSYAPVALAWLAPLLSRRLGLRRITLALGAGLLGCRLVEQFSTMPMVDVWAALGGTACFMGLLPLLFAGARAEGAAGSQAFALGLLFGLSVDTGLRGVTGTLDLSWMTGLGPRLVVVGLAGLFAFVLWLATSLPIALTSESYWAGLPLIGLGALLFAEWQFLQSQGWVATLTGWPPTLALAWIMLGNAGSLLAAGYAFGYERPGAVLASAALVLGLFFVQVPGWIAAAGVLAGLVSAGFLLAVIVGAAQPRRAPLGRVFGLAMLCLLGFCTLYYFSFLAPLLPLPRFVLAPLAGVVLAVCALGAGRQAAQRRRAWRAIDRAPVGLGALLLLAPLSLWMVETTNGPLPAAPAGGSLRVMTYNIRSAYGLNGRQDVDAIARVIEGPGAEVVGLQEFSRGWLINGSTDLLPLLARRLRMPAAVMGGATDPTFGNAVLSRYPILASGHGVVPSGGSLVGRGYTWAEIAWEAGEPVLVMSTHLATEGAEVRLPQVRAVLAAWAGRPRTVLVGDMNALPGSPEIRMILEAGFIDAWAAAGQPERARIDWIFHTPDLAAHEVVVIESPASDHPAFAATLRPAP